MESSLLARSLSSDRLELKLRHQKLTADWVNLLCGY